MKVIGRIMAMWSMTDGRGGRIVRIWSTATVMTEEWWSTVDGIVRESEVCDSLTRRVKSFIIYLLNFEASL